MTEITVRDNIIVKHRAAEHIITKLLYTSPLFSYAQGDTCGDSGIVAVLKRNNKQREPGKDNASPTRLCYGSVNIFTYAYHIGPLSEPKSVRLNHCSRIEMCVYSVFCNFRNHLTSITN